jgi:hypothetical protein
MVVPPGPEQLNAYDFDALKAPVDKLPLVVRLPDQAPVAAQELASVEDQLSVELPPLEMVGGLALKRTLGCALDTVTVADCDAVPPAPRQVSVKFAVDVSVEVLRDPLVASAPFQPPEAVQALALVADQLKVDAAPFFTVLGLADKVTAGADAVTETVVDCVVLPPEPVHASE